MVLKLPWVLKMNEIIKIDDFSFTYNHGSKAVRVLKNINLSLFPGEVVGLVGESGSGKSTLAKAMLRIPDFKYDVSNENCNIYVDRHSDTPAVKFSI